VQDKDVFITALYMEFNKIYYNFSKAGLSAARRYRREQDAQRLLAWAKGGTGGAASTVERCAKPCQYQSARHY
jgi:hypothetical protein